MEHRGRETWLVNPRLLRTYVLDIAVRAYDIMMKIKCYVLSKKIAHMELND